jgi:hypothetical protein
MTVKYRHIKTGNIYFAVGTGKVKIDGQWIDSMTYRNEAGDLFTRTLLDFEYKFEMVEE